MTLRALIVDHESESRKSIRSVLNREPDLEIVDVCVEGKSAMEAVERHRPDVMFVDVDAPGFNGFSLLQSGPGSNLPKIVVTTNTKDYALRAIEAQALDYLLKPVSADRLHRSVTKAREQLTVERNSFSLPSAPPAAVPAADRLAFKSKGVIKFALIQDIQWVEAQGNYVKVFVHGEAHLIRETMGRIEQRLSIASMIRIHRSRLVNLRFVREIQALTGNQQSLVVMLDGTQFPLSRGCRANVSHLIR
ncbi:MAG: response regulator transcription factor [Acidobacteriales bacterium]|nr:response regulator transcription factor [Terriglobales bacterium]